MPQNSAVPPIRSIFAKRLKTLRIEQGYPTARSFALALEIDENRYTRYERAEVEPDLALLAKICTLLTMTPNDLLDFSTPANSPATGFMDGKASSHHVPMTEATGAATRRSALAWQLAEHIVDYITPAPADALDRLAQISRLVADIVPDPFLFISRVKSEILSGVLEGQAAARIAALVEALIEAAKEDALGRSRESSALPSRPTKRP